MWDWNCLRINCWTSTSPLEYAIEDGCLGCVALLMSQPSVNMDLRKICYYDCCHSSFSAAAPELPENYDRWSSNSCSSPLLEYFSIIQRLYYRNAYKLNLDLLNFLIQHPRVNINTKSFEHQQSFIHLLVENFGRMQRYSTSLLEPLSLIHI